MRAIGQPQPPFGLGLSEGLSPQTLRWFDRLAIRPNGPMSAT